MSKDLLSFITVLSFTVFFIIIYRYSIIDGIRKMVKRLGKKWADEDLPYQVYLPRICNYNVTSLKRQCKKDADLKTEVNDYFEYWIREHKKLVSNRTFAYDYEEMLFEVFTFIDERGLYKEYESLTKEEVISRMVDIGEMDKEKAETLFYVLDSKGIIDSSAILGIDKVRLGLILHSGMWGWNIVSEDDMNLSKWIYLQNKKN